MEPKWDENEVVFSERERLFRLFLSYFEFSFPSLLRNQEDFETEQMFKVSLISLENKVQLLKSVKKKQEARIVQKTKLTF